MENPRLEAQFKDKKKKLKSSQEEAKKILENEELTEKDRIRLTRALQLVERFQPERKIEDPQALFWKRYLETLYRFLPARKKKEDVIVNASAHSYLLAEKTIATLRELRSLDHLLKVGTLTKEEVLAQERSEKVTREETFDTSLTLEYERKNWGVERICLDGIQNHLPSDSKGEHVWVTCLVDGKWISLDEAREKKDDIQAVRFADDGVGFDVKNLALLYSTKTGEKESRGQFGEGMKLMAAAALREGLNPEIESQNWTAQPISKEVKIFDTSKQKNQELQQLAFHIRYLEGEDMIGSRTTFHSPTPAFLEELLKIEDKVLALRENYRPVFTSSAGNIVDRNPGKIFVKGIFVTNKNTILSYDFEDVETNRDRNALVSSGLEEKIARIIGEISDKRLIKTLLQQCLAIPNVLEASLYYLTTEYPQVWVEAFYEAFGKDAVLDTGFEAPKVLNASITNKIKLPSGFTNILIHSEVRTDKKVTPNFWQEMVPTSLTIEYGKDVWSEERILLDAVQNHLPSDSGGYSIDLRVKTKDRKWHWFGDLERIKDSDIEAIKVSDSGRGYDHRLLGFFYSTKGESDNSAGKFGEGLKMLSVASLRQGVDITLRSRNWSAKPRALRQEVDGQQIDQLVFDITHSVKNENSEDRSIYEMSSTTFTNPTTALIKEFREVNKKVLGIEGKKPVEATYAGELLSLGGGMIYARQILIPGDHNILFSYHLSKGEIKNRDRNFVDEEELAIEIGKIWSAITSREAISAYLLQANRSVQKRARKDKLEFALQFFPSDIDTWKEVFEEIFGKNVAIRDVKSEDYDAMQQNKHVGLDLISFPTAVFRTLQSLGLPTYESRIQEMTDVEPVPDNELSEKEKSVIKALVAVDEYLPDNRNSDVRIYTEKYPGQVAARGFSDGVSIHLKRDILQDFDQAADVYVHEKTHHNSGGRDASSEFRDYLTYALSRLAIEELKKSRPELFKTKQ